MTTDGHRIFVAIFAICCLVGCRPAPIATYATFAPPAIEYVPATGTDNAFDGYALAAEGAQEAAGKYLSRASFTLGERQAAQKLLQPFTGRIAGAAKEPCEFEFSPRAPFVAVRYDRGWRLLGLCLYWNIQDAAAAGDFDRAVSYTVLATRFGFDLTGGGAIDASTGLHIADDARKALALYLDRLSPEQLRALEDGLKAALLRKAPVTQTIGHEKADMMAIVQSIQEHFRDGTLDQIEQAFGPDSREPISYLKDLQPTDPKRIRFFKGLAEYADSVASYADKLAATPVVNRAKIPGPDVPVDRAWRRLAKYVVRAPLPLVEINDVTLARTRLFVIEAELTRRRKLHMPLPPDLSGFTTPISIDPYTGTQFIYRTNGEDYLVYSVGKDGLDNAGQTDSAFLQPDLRLERPVP
jgi:hypothetical protein